MPSVDNLTKDGRRFLHAVPDIVPFAEQHNVAALSNWKQEKHVQAIQRFKKATFHAPLEPSYHLHRAEVHLEIGDICSAIACYQSALLCVSASSYLEMRLGMLLLSQGQIYLDLGLYDRAYVCLQNTIKLNPRSMGTLLGLALSEIGLGRQEDGLRTIQEAITLNDSLAEPLAEPYVIRAKLNLKRRQIIDTYQDLLKIEEITGGRHAEVEGISRQIIEICVAYRNEASKQTGQQQFGIAMKLIDRAIQIYPREEHLYLQRAIVRQRMGLYDDALADFDRLDKTMDEHALKQRVTCYLDYAKKMNGDKNYARALELLNIALKDGFFQEKVVRVRADSMFGMRRWAEALRDFKACNDKSLQHKCAIVHFELASVQFKGGNLKQALALLDEALDENPALVKALILHGRACLQLEDVKQAREDVTRALQLDHKNLGARTLLGQIEEYENQMELPERKELDMVIGIPLRKADQSSDDGASD